MLIVGISMAQAIETRHSGVRYRQWGCEEILPFKPARWLKESEVELNDFYLFDDLGIRVKVRIDGSASSVKAWLQGRI